MFTLRIIFTGLIAFGPINGFNADTKDAWVLMVRVENPKHNTELRLGCTAEGDPCVKVYDLTKHDLRLMIDGNPLIKDRPFRVDYTFREHVVDVSEVTGLTNMGHFKCNDPLRKQLGNKKGLALKNDLTIPVGSGNPGLQVSSRMYLTAGLEFDSGSKTCKAGGTHCYGRLSAGDIPTCARWKFTNMGRGERCTYMANTVIYELRVHASDLRFEFVSHEDLKVTATDNLVPAQGTGVLEVWVRNAPDDEPEKFDHFTYLYDLFKAGEIKQGWLPEPDFVKNCKDLPGLRPIKCPAMQFQ